MSEPLTKLQTNNESSSSSTTATDNLNSNYKKQKSNQESTPTKTKATTNTNNFTKTKPFKREKLLLKNSKSLDTTNNSSQKNTEVNSLSLHKNNTNHSIKNLNRIQLSPLSDNNENLNNNISNGNNESNSNSNSIPALIHPIESPVYGGQPVTITLPFDLAKQANLSQKTVQRIYRKQKALHKIEKFRRKLEELELKKEGSEDPHDRSPEELEQQILEQKEIIKSSESYKLPSLFVLITGSTQRHLCELKIRKIANNFVSFCSILPEHEPPEKTKISLIVWRNNQLQKSNSAESSVTGVSKNDNNNKSNSNSNPKLNEPLSSAMTLTSNFSYIIDQTCYLSVYLAQSVYNLDALEDWDAIEGPQFSLAQEDFATLDQRLCCAFDHLFLPENWTVMGSSEEPIESQSQPRETLLHFAARLGLEQLTALLITKPRSVYAVNIKNRHGELPLDIARKNRIKICGALKQGDQSQGSYNQENPFTKIEELLLG